MSLCPLLQRECHFYADSHLYFMSPFNISEKWKWYSRISGTPVILQQTNVSLMKPAVRSPLLSFTRALK